ncbi:hypothetical protein VYU27_005575 [Nannochloropsis oceanica]
MLFGSDEEEEGEGGDGGDGGDGEEEGEGEGLEPPPLSFRSDDDFSNFDQAMMDEIDEEIRNGRLICHHTDQPTIPDYLIDCVHHGLVDVANVITNPSPSPSSSSEPNSISMASSDKLAREHMEEYPK